MSTKRPKTVELEVGLDRQSLINGLVEFMSYDELLQFIKDLEMAAEDWQLTLELHEYFSKEYRKYRKEFHVDDDRKPKARRAGH